MTETLYELNAANDLFVKTFGPAHLQIKLQEAEGLNALYAYLDLEQAIKLQDALNIFIDWQHCLALDKQIKERLKNSGRNKA